jgi:hypothetical protein
MPATLLPRDPFILYNQFPTEKYDLGKGSNTFSRPRRRPRRFTENQWMKILSLCCLQKVFVIREPQNGASGVSGLKLLV